MIKSIFINADSGQNIYLNNDKINYIEIYQDLITTFPLINLNIQLPGFTIRPVYVEITFEVNDLKKSCIFYVYKTTKQQSVREDNYPANNYIMKGIGVPFKNIVSKNIKKDRKEGEIIIKNMFDYRFNNFTSNEYFKVRVLNKFVSNSITWKRLNFTDLQYLNHIKKYIKTNDNNFIPAFFMKYRYNEGYENILDLSNYHDYLKKDAETVLKGSSITFSSNEYKFDKIEFENKSAKSKLHITKPFFSSVKQKDNFHLDDRMYTDEYNDEKYMVNMYDNIENINSLYRNTDDISINLINSAETLSLFEPMKVLGVSYNNQDTDLEVDDIAYFKVVGYKLMGSKESSNFGLSGELYTNKM